jgi:hypothetical protein
MAFVIAPVSFPWSLFLLVASLFTVFALVVIVLEGHRKQLAAALLIACVLATPAVVGAVPLAAQCEAWWNAGDWYHYVLYNCYLVW